jgi:hypothetical protein
MSRMLLLVPRMYTEKEFKDAVSVLPDDFDLRTLEFWSYVEDKLQAYVGKIQRVYRDEIADGGEEGLAALSAVQPLNYLIVKKLVDAGATFEETEDPMLIVESASWVETIKNNPFDPVSLEMYQETIKERDGYVSKRIDETLGEDETGVLFIKPKREVNLKESVKVIKVCRFEPSDYLSSWQAQLKSKGSGS